MSRNLRGTIIIFALFWFSGCAPRLFRVGEIPSSVQEGSGQGILVVRSIQIYADGAYQSHNDEEKLFEMFRQSLLSRGIFRDVVRKPKGARDPEPEVNLRLEVINNVKYNWWITWPVIYPATLWWPIQKYTANAIVSFEVSGRGWAGRSLPWSQARTLRYSQAIYGLYFKGGLTDEIESAIEDMVIQFARESAPFSSEESVEKMPDQPVVSKNFVEAKKSSRAITNIAVMDFKSSNATLARVVTDKVIEALLQRRQYQIIERSAMEMVLQEQTLQASGACDSDQCLVQMGRLLGVDALVTGTAEELGNLRTVSLRMIDVESGKILMATSGETEKGIADLLNRVVPSLLR